MTSLFKCNLRGPGVIYFLFFSSHASSFVSHFFSLMISQSFASVFLLSDLKMWNLTSNFRSWLVCLGYEISIWSNAPVLFYLVNSPKSPRAEDFNPFQFCLFQDAQLCLVWCCSAGRERLHELKTHPDNEVHSSSTQPCACRDSKVLHSSSYQLRIMGNTGCSWGQMNFKIHFLKERQKINTDYCCPGCVRLSNAKFISWTKWTKDIEGEGARWKERGGRQIIVERERLLTFFCLITARVEKGTDLIAREG